MFSGSVVLASASPRRREILGMLFPRFDVVPADIDEVMPLCASAAETVESLAAQKARHVAKTHDGSLVIGSDTLVYLDGQALGKPRDEAQARQMLASLSGRTHQVYTGVCLVYGCEQRIFHSSADVSFAKMSEREINWYVATGEPMDKAGAYGIQGYGSRFVKSINGDFFTVMGLPLNALYENLGDFPKFFFENS